MTVNRFLCHGKNTRLSLYSLGGTDRPVKKQTRSQFHNSFNVWNWVNWGDRIIDPPDGTLRMDSHYFNILSPSENKTSRSDGSIEMQ